jgi:hypothetical protein
VGPNEQRRLGRYPTSNAAACGGFPLPIYRTDPLCIVVSGVGESGIAVPSTSRPVDQLRPCLPSTHQLCMAFSSFSWTFCRRGPQLLDFLWTLSPDAFKSATFQLQGNRPLNHNPLRDSTPPVDTNAGVCWSQEVLRTWPPATSPAGRSSMPCLCSLEPTCVAPPHPLISPCCSIPPIRERLF